MSVAASNFGSEKIYNNYFDRMTVSGKHKLLFFIIMLAFFFEQMDNWNFGFIAPQLIKNGMFTLQQIGQIQLWYFVGMTVGGLAGGIVSDFFGRRKTFLGAVLIFSLASVGNALSTDFHSFVITRTMTGVGIFCLMVCSQTYITEVAPAESRGKWMGLVAAVGFSAVPVIGIVCRLVIPLAPEAWRYIFGFGGLGLLAFVLGCKYLHESPRWLVGQNRVAEAEEVIEKITRIKVDLSQAAAAKEPAAPSVGGTITGLFSSKYIVRTLVIAALYIITTPACFTVTTWTPTLLAQKGFSVADSLTISSALMFGVPVGCYMASIFSDKGGRKKPIVITLFLMAVFALLFAQVSGFGATVVVGFLLIATLMCNNFIVFSYIAESYPTKMRNTSSGIHLAAGRFATSMWQPVIPMISTGAGIWGAMGFSGFTGVYTAVAILIILPIPVLILWGLNTGGKSLEEIS